MKRFIAGLLLIGFASGCSFINHGGEAMPNYTLDFRTESTDAVPADLIGSTYWYDSELPEVNGEKVYYDTSNLYAKWESTTKGEIVTIKDDVGNESVADYFSIRPSDVFANWTAGGMDNLTLPRTGEGGGKARYSLPTAPLGGAVLGWYVSGTKWILDNDDFETESTDDTEFPWLATWPAGVTVTEAPYANQYAGQGAFSGTLTLSTNVISDAWYRAETTVFESLSSFMQCTEKRSCWRGAMPLMGDNEEFKSVNTWAFSSGTSADFDLDRVTGDNPVWCSLRVDALVDGLFETRERAMNFAGMVLAWLKSTDNLSETGNVFQCVLSAIPPRPEEYITKGRLPVRYWQQTIQLEIVYVTESVYS